ncbi:MAG TPA: SGNH/GDSL hydrolase family protein [Polyangiaceae bacterium]|nr:SGNH/GDSL hydrolase family protein [Polyangiaceae bacterium]
MFWPVKRWLCPMGLALWALPQVANAETVTDTHAEPLRPKKQYIVAAIGDSLTDARGGGGKYLSYLRKRCPGSQFDNYGRGGEMVNQMRRRFMQDILGPAKPTYTHVIVFGGVNDVYSDQTAKRTPAKIQADLLAMYTMAKEAGIHVVALTIAPWGGFRRYFNPTRASATRQVNRWIDQQQQEGVIASAIDAYGLLSCGDPEKLCPDFEPPFRDGLHFNEKGHERLGEALWSRVFSDCR